MHGIEQFSVFRFEAATAFLNFITVLVMSLRLLELNRGAVCGGATAVFHR
jgi:hypothetical protein